jgi:hypothetical protein
LKWKAPERSKVVSTWDWLLIESGSSVDWTIEFVCMVGTLVILVRYAARCM